MLLFPFFYVCFITGKLHAAFFLKRIWGYTIVYGSFLFPVVKYKKHKRKFPSPCVIVSNHTSYLDIVLTPFYVKDTALFMGKSELLKAPLFRYFFVYMDIPVNRKSTTGSHRALVEAGKRLDLGYNMIIYPEGTISSEGKLRAFKNGAFKLAIEKQVPIVPVVNLNNWQFLQNGGFFKSYGRPGIPRIIVGEAIETKGMKEEDIDELKKKVFTFTQQELDKYNGQ